MKNWFYILLLFVPVFSHAQFQKTVESTEVQLPEGLVRLQDTVTLTILVDMVQDWYLYSSDVGTDEGPLAAELKFIEHSSYEPVGSLVPVGHKHKRDAFFGVDVNYFPEVGKFKQKVVVKEKNPQIKMQLSGQACNDVKQSCVLVSEVIEVPPIKVSEKARVQEVKKPEKKSVPKQKKEKKVKPSDDRTEEKPVEKPEFSSKLEELKWEKEQLLKKNPKVKEDLDKFVKRY